MGIGMTAAGMGLEWGQNLKILWGHSGDGDTTAGTDGDGDVNVSLCGSLI